MPSSASPDWLPDLPAEFYEQLASCISLYGMACIELLSRSDEPLVQQLPVLTHLSLPDVQVLGALQGSEALRHALHTQPQAVYSLLLLGRLTLDTSLAAPVLAYVQRNMDIDEAQLEQLLLHCQQLSTACLTVVEEHLSAEPPVGVLRLRVEELFSKYVSDRPEPAPPVASFRFAEGRLQLLRLALLLVQSFARPHPHPFLAAVAALPQLRPALLAPLLDRINQVQPPDELPLSAPELLQLYQVLQICGMVFVSDLVEEIGLTDLFPPSDDNQAREVVSAMISSFTEWMHQNFPDQPALQEVRRQILTLPDKL